MAIVWEGELNLATLAKSTAPNVARIILEERNRKGIQPDPGEGSQNQAKEIKKGRGRKVS